MRPTVLLFAVLAATSANASWFGTNKPEYNTWDEAQLKAWLQAHNIQPPEGYNSVQLQDLVKSNWESATAWTADQYAHAQKAFADVRDDTFGAWDESRLRQFLLDQGVVEPKGTREQLEVLARQKYFAYQSYTSSLSSRASTAVYGDPTTRATKSAKSAYTDASGSVTSAASVASQSGSSAYVQVSSTASSIAAQASAEVARQLDDSKDYVYSTWEDSQLRQWLQDKGLVEPHAQTTREQLLNKMRGAYISATDPAYHAWADSYLRHWLIAHDLISSSHPEKDTWEFRQALVDNLSRDALLTKMNQYYYGTKDTVFSTWSDSDLHAWLVQHGIVKSEAQIKRDKLAKMVQDNFGSAQDTIWSAWSDSQMREWLIEHGYLRTDAQKTRDELVRMMNAKYNDASAKTAAYLTWPDARLRAYLRNRGMSEDALPTSRPSLLQETRIRWVQTQTQAEAAYAGVLASVHSGVAAVQAQLGALLDLVTGAANNADEKAHARYDDARAYADGKARDAARKAERAGWDAKAGYADASGTVNSKLATASGDARGAKEWVQGKAGSVSAEAGKATAKVKAEL